MFYSDGQEPDINAASGKRRSRFIAISRSIVCAVIVIVFIIAMAGCVRRTDGGLVDRAVQFCSEHGGIDALVTNAGFENSPEAFCRDGVNKNFSFERNQ